MGVRIRTHRPTGAFHPFSQAPQGSPEDVQSSTTSTAIIQGCPSRFSTISSRVCSVTAVGVAIIFGAALAFALASAVGSTDRSEGLGDTLLVALGGVVGAGVGVLGVPVEAVPGIVVDGVAPAV